ncbi:ribosomal protein S6 kinase-like 1 isoform X1 [Haliaeetus albicilla]|uniref:ribosomal protein S6 kinase-like 1 isoform X1 n=1 Tax=Haliaeetus albicilla TaxID=8969 RepID=UPI0037E80997
MSRPEAEPCSRALAQARVYLGQLRSRVSPAGPEGGGRRDYLVEAARQLRLALERDVSEDYEEAFNHYQNGVDVLLRGVQVDPNKERREAVKRKITQYLRRAEEIFNCHLQRAAGGGNPTATGYSSLRFRPIRTLSSAVENLRRCKVVGVIDKVQIVQDPATGGTFILKSLPKSHVETRERQTIIPHGVPFMVKLLCYYVSEDSIFLHLEHVQGETLWSHLRSKYCVQQGSGSSNTIQALRDRGREDGVGSSQGSSQVSIFSARTGSGLPGSATHQVLGNTAASPTQEQSPDPMDPGSGNHCQLRLAPASSTRAAPGGQDLSVTQAVSGIVDHAPAVSAKGPGHLTGQGLVVYPWDVLTSGVGCISERAASQQDPRLPQTLTPVLKTVRGGQPGTGDLPSQQVSEVPWARPLLILGHRQLRAGVATSSSGKPCGPDPVVREPSRGASLTCGWLGKQPLSGQCRALPSHGHGRRAWAVKEEQVQLWAAEILLALEGLHQQGVLCQDLNPRNLLLDAAGHVRLTFFGQWTEVEPQYCSQAQEELYSAPATVPKPPFRDSTSHPAASARGAQPGCYIAAHGAPAVQPEAALGLWRRWHGEAEVPLLLQHRPMEQAGGLGRLSFPQGAGHRATVPGICDPRWHWQLCLLGGGLPARAAPVWGTHEVLQPCMFCLCLCLLVSPREEAVVWARLSSPLGPPSWEKEPRCPPPERGYAPLLGHPLLSLPLCPGTPSLWFLSLLLPQGPPRPCYFLWLQSASPPGPTGWCPSVGVCSHP